MKISGNLNFIYPLLEFDFILRLKICQSMSEKDVDWQLHIYGDSMHSFTNPEANNPDFGTVYSKEADRRSWMLLMDFLEEVFS